MVVGFLEMNYTDLSDLWVSSNGFFQKFILATAVKFSAFGKSSCNRGTDK